MINRASEITRFLKALFFGHRTNYRAVVLIVDIYPGSVWRACYRNCIYSMAGTRSVWDQGVKREGAGCLQAGSGWGVNRDQAASKL